MQGASAAPAAVRAEAARRRGAAAARRARTANPRRRPMRAASFIFAAFAAAWVTPAPAQSSQIGTVTQLSGVLVARQADGGTRLLGVQSAVAEGEILITEQATYARVKFADEAELVLRPSSQLKIESYRFANAQPEKDSMLLSLLKGGLR